MCLFSEGTRRLAHQVSEIQKQWWIELLAVLIFVDRDVPLAEVEGDRHLEKISRISNTTIIKKNKIQKQYGLLLHKESKCYLIFHAHVISINKGIFMICDAINISSKVY